LKNVDERERRDLEWALGSLRSIDMFVKIIETLPPHTQVHALHFLSAVMCVAFVTGSHASLSDTQHVFRQTGAQSDRGKKSGRVRLKNRPWTTHAKELAISIRSEQPALSREKLMSEIEFGWKSDVATPGRDALERYIKELEASGELPPKKVTG
jgi:hypothetical protein